MSGQIINNNEYFIDPLGKLNSPTHRSLSLTPYFSCLSGKIEPRSSQVRIIPHRRCISPSLSFPLPAAALSSLWGGSFGWISLCVQSRRSNREFACYDWVQMNVCLLESVNLLPETQPPSVFLPFQVRYLLLLEVIKLWTTATPLSPPPDDTEITEAWDRGSQLPHINPRPPHPPPLPSPLPASSVPQSFFSTALLKPAQDSLCGAEQEGEPATRQQLHVLA